MSPFFQRVEQPERSWSGFENTVTAVDLPQHPQTILTSLSLKMKTTLTQLMTTTMMHFCVPMLWFLARRNTKKAFLQLLEYISGQEGTLVTVKNDTPHLLHDSNKPLIVTSIRKSDETGGQTFGHEYTVDSGCENTIRIDYTWDVDGSTPIPPCRIINWPLHSHSVTGYLSNYPGKLARCEVLVVSVTEAALHKTLRNNK